MHDYHKGSSNLLDAYDIASYIIISFVSRTSRKYNILNIKPLLLDTQIWLNSVHFAEYFMLVGANL